MSNNNENYAISFFIVVAIGFLYYGLSKKGTDIILNTDQFESENNKKCLRSQFNNDNYNACLDENKLKKDEHEKQHFIYTFVLSIIGFLISFYLYSKENKVSSVGIAFGSLMLLLVEIFWNWYKFDSNTKFMIYALSFGILVYSTSTFFT